MKPVGRKSEIEALKRYEASCKPEFVVVYGRRRVGKTFLVRQYFDDRFFFYATGVAMPDIGSNLERFGRSLAQYGIGPGDTPRSWMEAFDRLSEGIKKAGGGKRKVIFLDEMPWMDTPRSNFVTALEYFWNSFASVRNDILFIACGSAASWTTKKIFRNRGGLHNRITGKIHIKPFTLSECEEYMRARNIVIDRRDIAEAYMIFGGIPYYLGYWDGKFGVPGNVDRILFYESAPLRDEFQSLYSSLFVNSDQYIDIVNALGRKNSGLTRDELLKALGQKDGGRLSEALENLEISDFLRYYTLFPGKANGGVYQLTDCFSLFHQTFIRNNRGMNEHYWSDMRETPKITAWRGYAFEQVCLRHAPQIKAALGISGIAANIYSWRSRTASPATQIDLVIDRADGLINLCEIKFSKYEFEITKAYGETLKNRVRAFQSETGTRGTPHITFVSTYGLKRNQYAAMVQSEVTLDDLFNPAVRIRGKR
jgi:hypothetical protein